MNWSAFFARDHAGRWFMNVWDKVDVSDALEDFYKSKARFCPPHRLPHVLPIFGQPVTDERCHYHATWWRQYSHHQEFCWLIGCPHYADMVQARRGREHSADRP